MTNLFDLLDEILVEIIQHLEYDGEVLARFLGLSRLCKKAVNTKLSQQARTIRSLMTSTRRLHRVVKPFFYRHTLLGSSCQARTTFYHMLDQNPTLLEYTESVIFRCEHENDFEHKRQSLTESKSLKEALKPAHVISSLIQLHRDEYRVDCVHQFAMYAVMLTLFAALEQPTLNVNDHNFCSFKTAFSIMTLKSQVGVTSKSSKSSDTRSDHGSTVAEQPKLPAGLKERFNDSKTVPASKKGYGENPEPVRGEPSEDEYSVFGE
ncbi:hypothetical protein BJX63DRAFT_436555 [Aspergillus granulosus]|uniref:F-box domain-containing protein n=1 Tax=Aspergillus granulosus TaxID=176169 RepID=A0ABR4GXQ9_9EURO